MEVIGSWAVMGLAAAKLGSAEPESPASQQLMVALFQVEQQVQLPDQVIAAGRILGVARLAAEVVDAGLELLHQIALLVQQRDELTGGCTLPQSGRDDLGQADSVGAAGFEFLPLARELFAALGGFHPDPT